jgi:hypothetical protein
MKITVLIRFVIAFGITFSMNVDASKLTPEGSFIERKLASRSQSYWEKFLAGMALKGIHKIGEPVHEEITNRILGCVGDADICGAPDYDPKNAYVLAGVRWNDDPPFRFEKNYGNFSGCEAGATVRLVTFPQCWANVFKNGEKRAGRGDSFNSENASLLVRSHFGDLQFLHAMASKDGETTVEIRERILMWAEFTWRIALGEVKLSTYVKDVPVAGINKLFLRNGWSVQDLFALGNPHVRKPEYMSEVAFGSLLHMVQDSFADGHVQRASADSSNSCLGISGEIKMPGKIIEFHSYVNQNPEKHGGDDERNAFSKHWSSSTPNVVDIGSELNRYFVRRATWEEVKPYVECIFALDTEVKKSSSGEKYAR